MKYIKEYKIFESNQIWDLEDICQEIKDDGFSVNIRSRRGNPPSILSETTVEIFNGDRKNFMMVNSMSEFLFRLRDWSKEEGYEISVRGKSAYQTGDMVKIMEDGRILTRGSTCTPNYPSFIMLEIYFNSLAK
jgi:hypothetical protein